MSQHFSVELQRLRYWQGQKLKSQDLRDQIRYNALLQAWHDRALHNAYGVRMGLQVLLESAEVLIKPGIAYDIHGSSLTLEEDRRLPIPTSIPPGGLYLILERKSSGGPEKGLSLLKFRWENAYKFNPHDGVALARLLPGPALDRFFNLPVTRPQTGPRRFYSASLTPNTSWQIWLLDEDQNLEGGNLFLGLKVDVDTTAAEFTKTPCYFVWLTGDLWSSDLPTQYLDSLEPTPRTIDQARARLRLGLAAIQILVMRFGHIAETTPTGFTYRLWLPRALISSMWDIALDDLLDLALKNPFTLNWLGIQMNHEIKENYGITGQNPHD